MIAKLRVVTTHGTYEKTLSDEDRADIRKQGGTTEDLAREMSKVLGSDGSRDFICQADGIGWVGFNPSYIVAIEVVEVPS